MYPLLRQLLADVMVVYQYLQKTRYDRCQEVRANYFCENEGDDGGNDDNLDHLHVDTSQQIMIKITTVRMMMMLMMMMMFNANAIIVMLIIGPLQVAIHVVLNRHAGEQ